MKRQGIFTSSAIFALAFSFSSCASFFEMPASRPAETTQSETPKAVEKQIEGVWKHASAGKFYEISGSDGSMTMTNFAIRSDGARDYSSTPTTFERGSKRKIDASCGYLYGYNKSRPGWIAYYYTLNGDSLNLTQCLNANGGATWNSIDEAKSSADIAKPGVVKMDLTRAD